MRVVHQLKEKITPTINHRLNKSMRHKCTTLMENCMEMCICHVMQGLGQLPQSHYYCTQQFMAYCV